MVQRTIPSSSESSYSRFKMTNSIILWLGSAATIPNALLVFLVALSAWVLHTAQREPSFDIGQMLTDENGKPSSSRFAVLISLGITSYILAYVFVNKKVEDSTLQNMFYAYIITWASSKAVEKLIDAWSGKRNGYVEPQQTEKVVDNVTVSIDSSTKKK